MSVISPLNPKSKRECTMKLQKIIFVAAGCEGFLVRIEKGGVKGMVKFSELLEDGRDFVGFSSRLSDFLGQKLILY
jgi:hypothetical protein